MKIVAIANQKGGVGKTTTAVNLSVCLAEKKKRVLLLDLDPQANATGAIGEPVEEGSSLYGMLTGEVDTSPESLLIETRFDGLHLIPSHRELAGAEIDMVNLGNHLSRLGEIFQPLRDSGRFDYALIDCPPSLGILMTAALACVDDLLIPVQCEFFGLEGLQNILEIFNRLQEGGVNEEARLEGIVMTMHDSRTRLAKGVIESVRSHYPDEVYKTLIPRTIRLGEAPSHRSPIIEYEPSGAGAKAYRALAAEFLSRRTSKKYQVT